ncbi:MAG: hypothetical protein J5J00_08940 [Deltaproteobacteria bacterium]|nr:hypothetical protein [Deltaproteobacteria bacterium]
MPSTAVSFIRDRNTADRIIDYASSLKLATEQLAAGIDHILENEWRCNPEDSTQHSQHLSAVLSDGLKAFKIANPPMIATMNDWIGKGYEAAEEGIKLMASLIDLKDSMVQLQHDMASKGLPLTPSSVEAFTEGRERFNKCLAAFEVAALREDFKNPPMAPQTPFGSASIKAMALPVLAGAAACYVGYNLAGAFFGPPRRNDR